MFFLLSKTISILLEPLVHPFLLMLVALFARWRRKSRLYRACVFLAMAVPLTYGIVPLSQSGLMFLENRFPVPVFDDRPLDGIIVLGGHTGSGVISMQRNQPQQSGAAERFTMGIKLHRQFPDVPLVFSGFSGRLVHRGWGEDEIIQRLLSDLGIFDDRILFEAESRNTYENAVKSRELVLPQPGARWVLITSALHMPRAVGAFEAAGWRGLIPYPVDYKTGTDFDTVYNLKGGIGSARTLLHEAAGLLVYRLTGRSASLLPGAQ
jgi:uncharacterized SAM-binding protein YcdF (DUF218 family)